MEEKENDASNRFEEFLKYGIVKLLINATICIVIFTVIIYIISQIWELNFKNTLLDYMLLAGLLIMGLGALFIQPMRAQTMYTGGSYILDRHHRDMIKDELTSPSGYRKFSRTQINMGFQMIIYGLIFIAIPLIYGMLE